MAVNIFGSGNNDFYDIERDLDLNNNTIHNVKDPENEQDVVNKKYVDGKLVAGTGWNLDGNTLLTDGKMGSLNDFSFSLVRNNVPQMTFFADRTVAYKHFYVDSSPGEAHNRYMGMETLSANKEFGLFFGNNKNMISWKNGANQPMRYLSSSGFVFLTARNFLLTMTNVIRPHKNIDMGTISKIINLPAPENANDCATKAYSDLKVLKSGDVMTGNLFVNISNTDATRSLGCNNLWGSKTFNLLLGNAHNKIEYTIGRPVNFITTNGLDVFAFSRKFIGVGDGVSNQTSFYCGILMHGQKISDLATPNVNDDAVNKRYCDTNPRFVKKSGDTMTGNLLFDCSNMNLELGCNTSAGDHTFCIYLGSPNYFIKSESGGIDMKTLNFFNITVNITDPARYQFRSTSASFGKPLHMNNNKIETLANPTEPSDAVNKQYVDAKYEELNARLQRLESRT